MGGTSSIDPLSTPRRTHTPTGKQGWPVRVAVMVLVFAMAAGLLSALAIMQRAEQTAEASYVNEVKRIISSVGPGVLSTKSDDEFGSSVAVSGDTAVVGAPFVSPGSGAAFVFQQDEGGADNWGQVKKLESSDGLTSNDEYGAAVAISGDIIVVGAKFSSSAVANGGAAYLFARDAGGAGNWGEVAILTPSDPDSFSRFGISVAASGNFVIVGARYAESAGVLTGAAYVYERDQGGTDNWGEIKKLTASDGDAGENFGYSVGASGDTAVVGAYDHSYPGAAYVFMRNEGGAGNWGEVKKLTASDPQNVDRFGISVAVSGETAIVGAYLEDGADTNPVDTNSGAAYVFERDLGGADNWGEVKKLTASDAQANDEFGISVALSGNTALVGAWDEDNGAGDTGAAYIFARDEGGAGNWGEGKKVTPAFSQGDAKFGNSVSLSDNLAVVGAGLEDQFGYVDMGAAYIFDDPAPAPTATPCPTEGCPPTDTPTITPTITATPTACPTPQVPAGGGCGFPTSTPTPSYHGAAMSLSVNGQTGFVTVENNSTFTVIVSADSVPFSTGYIGAQAWISFVDTGLLGKQNPQVIWPDCDLLTFGGGDQSSTEENAGCLTGLFDYPPSFYLGALFSFDVTCDKFGEHDIQLLSYSHPFAETLGAGYHDGTTAIPAEHSGDFIADEIHVQCAHDWYSPPPSDLDGDGCIDSAEQQVAPGSETTGGLRNYLHFWDFYDVAIAGGVKGQDLQVDLFNDIVGVIDHYAPVGTEPEYDKWYDRGPNAGPNAWNLTAPDGKIDLFNDIVGVIAQFGHDCR